VALARLISITGTSAASTALLFAVYERTRSAGWVAAALLVTLGTLGAMTPLGGALGDRFDRRRVMILSDLAGVVCYAVMAVLDGHLALLAVAFVASVAEAPFFPSAGGAVPNLVPPEDLAWANSNIAFGTNLGYLAGPALGGVLVAATGPTFVFSLNAVSFAVSAALVVSVRASFSSGRETADEAHRGIRAGFRFIWRDRMLRTMTIAFLVFASTIGAVLVAELPLSVSFGAGAAGYGLLSASFGIGGLAGAFAGRLVTPTNERRVVVAANFVTAMALASIVFARSFLFVLAAMVVGGTSDGLVDVAIEVIYQRRSPEAVRSRVIGALEAVFLTGLALSFPISAALIGAWGPKAAYAVAGGGAAIGTVMLLPILRHRDEPAVDVTGVRDLGCGRP